LPPAHRIFTHDQLAKEHTLQSRDDLSDDLAAHFRAHVAAEPELKPYPTARRVLAVIAAWLVPGAGHLLLGKVGRAVLFFVAIAGAFALGLALHGRLFWPAPADSKDAMIPFDLISLLWFFSQIGAGLCYLLPFGAGWGTNPQPWAATYEYGNAFMFLAGLLNYLVMYDAFDIGAGRKR
jgi:Family of unknown function (DUF6677)